MSVNYIDHVVDQESEIEYEIVDTAARVDISELESQIQQIEIEGFNLFDKSTLIAGYTISSNGGIAEKTGYSVTPLIPVDNSEFSKVRFSSMSYRASIYDANGDLITQSGNAYIGSAYALNISGSVKYIRVSFSNSTDFNKLMFAYSNDAKSLYGSYWEQLYGTSKYVPFRNAVDASNIYSKTAQQYFNIDTVQNRITPDEVMSTLSETSGVSVSIDEYTGMKKATFTGTDATVTWAQIIKKCEPCKCYLLEFYGMTNNDTYSASQPCGAILVVEFYDVNGALIGSKYNPFVMGTTSLKYHRYGFTSPVGANKISLRFSTRANSNMTIANVSINPINACPQRINQGIKIMGHQGMIYHAPKNTMPSFELGKIAGFDTMVTNINATSDNVLVALHDDTIDATSNGTGNVSDFTYEQLLTYDFGSWFSTVYTGTKIPKFEEVVKFLSESGIRLAVSLHNNLTASQLIDMCNIIKKYYATKVVIKSSSLAEIEAVHDIIGDFADYIFYGTASTANIDAIADLNYEVVLELAHALITDASIGSIIAYAKTNNVPLSVYFGNNSQVVKAFINLGVTSFTVDTFSDIVFPLD